MRRQRRKVMGWGLSKNEGRILLVCRDRRKVARKKRGRGKNGWRIYS
jgi:hypothetical protein